MPSVVLRVPIDEGSAEFIEVEVDRRDLGPAVDLVSDDDGREVGVAAFTLSSSLHRVLPAVSRILREVRAAAHAPDEIGMELGMKVGGETGIIFAKGTAEATFVMRLTWRRADPAGPV